MYVDFHQGICELKIGQYRNTFVIRIAETKKVYLVESDGNNDDHVSDYP